MTAPIPDPSGAASAAPRPVPSSNPVLKRALLWDALLAVAIAIVGGVLGGIFVGSAGVVSALIGAAMALVFTGVTAVSILVANRYSGSELFVGVFFGIVLGSWLLKFIVFIVLAVLLRHQPWIAPTVLFLSIIVGVIGSLVIDVIAAIKTRQPLL